MNAAHLHITLVHLPIVIMPLGSIILLWAMVKGSLPIIRLSLIMLLFAAIIAVPAFLLGGEAEEIVEHLPGISERLIEEHEEAADVAFWFTIASGVLSVFSLIGPRFGLAFERMALKGALIVSFIASIALAFTAQEGGKIRHPEAFQAKESTEPQ